MHAIAALEQNLEIGNASDLDTNGTGWIIGFSDWTKAGSAQLRHVPGDQLSNGPLLKWYNHPQGHPWGDEKPISEGRTLSLMISPDSEFRTEFSFDPTYPPDKSKSVTLRKSGDFVIWGAGIYHRSFGIRPATILTLRWTAQENAAGG